MLWTAIGRQVHVNSGGARAWAWEPVREPNRSGVLSSQTTRSAWREGVVTVATGLSMVAPVWPKLQMEQQPSCAPGLPV